MIHSFPQKIAILAIFPKKMTQKKIFGGLKITKTMRSRLCVPLKENTLGTYHKKGFLTPPFLFVIHTRSEFDGNEWERMGTRERMDFKSCI